MDDALLPRLSSMGAGGVLRVLSYWVVGCNYVTVFGGCHILHRDVSVKPFFCGYLHGHTLSSTGRLILYIYPSTSRVHALEPTLARPPLRTAINTMLAIGGVCT